MATCAYPQYPPFTFIPTSCKRRKRTSKVTDGARRPCKQLKACETDLSQCVSTNSLQYKHNKLAWNSDTALEQYYVDNLETRKEHYPVLFRIPTCAETTLRQDLISLINDLHINKGWCAFTPSRIGEYKSVDSAARALTAARRSIRTRDDVALNEAYREYNESVKVLRTSLDLSDATLLTVALLFLFEGLLRNRLHACVTHQKALTDILVARPRSQETSDFARAVLYTSTAWAFRFSMVYGTTSPFDEERWRGLEPADWGIILPRHISRLMCLNYQLFLRLPRLIAQVRALRTEAMDASVDAAIELIQALLLLEDAEAESQVLHRVHIVLTRDRLHRGIAPYSFQYNNVEEHKAALQYWENRLLLINLCFKLISLPSVLAYYKNEQLPFDLEKLRSDQQRMAINVFMSRQSAFGLGLYNVQVPQAFTGCWGAMAQIQGSTLCGMPTEFLREFILDQVSASYASWSNQFPKLTSQDMDDLSDIFQGGPITETLRRRYSFGRQDLESVPV